ncbi:MAG TPA: hypothetical protein DIU07_14350 [Rhodobacteraceae bacterium]|nr:hypothetical protein [Paracoccaceae bacterium]
MTQKAGNDAPEPRRSVWPRLLLVASLTLNVLVLSVVAGAHVRDGRDGRRAPPPDRAMLREGGFMPFFDAMPREARKRTAEAFREKTGGGKPDRAALAADFRGFVGALRAEPFAAEALAAVLEAQHDRAGARVSAGHTILVEQIAAMTPAERAGFADALEKRFHNALARAPGRAPGN